MAKKTPIVEFREKNPNQLQLELVRAGTPVVPSSNLALFLEIRASPIGRLLSQPSLMLVPQSSRVAATIPDLAPGTYYVDLRQEPAAGAVSRDGLCLLSILPIGSLSLVGVTENLSVIIDQSNTILSVDLNSTLVLWSTLNW